MDDTRIRLRKQALAPPTAQSSRAPLPHADEGESCSIPDSKRWSERTIVSPRSSFDGRTLTRAAQDERFVSFALNPK